MRAPPRPLTRLLCCVLWLFASCCEGIGPGPGVSAPLGRREELGRGKNRRSPVPSIGASKAQRVCACVCTPNSFFLPPQRAVDLSCCSPGPYRWGLPAPRRGGTGEA